jgi:dolichol-phosphate mannosyltransferase
VAVTSDSGAKDSAASRVEIGVVLPVHNEAGNVRPLVAEIFGVCAALGAPAAIALVNDGSTDSSGEEIRSLIAEDARCLTIAHRTNLGYGSAVRSGLAAMLARDPEWLMIMDADGSMAPRAIADFRARIRAGDDLVIGSRYGQPRNPASRHDRIFWRNLISWLGSLAARWSLGLNLRDYTLGMRAVRADLAGRWKLESSSFAILMEMVAEAVRLKARVANVPVAYHCRRGGESKFHYHLGLFIEYLRFLFVGARARRRVDH